MLDRVRVLVAPLRRYARHLGEDLRRGLGVRHLANDLYRFLAPAPAGKPVSFPPHPGKIYADFLGRLREDTGCVFRSLEAHALRQSPDPGRINIVLRHDVDGGDVAGLEALTSAEEQLGLRSSVHVLVDGTLYDPRPLVPLLARLRSQGFDIGLHTQCWMHVDFRRALSDDVRRFEDLAGWSPRTFSLHGAWPRTETDLARRGTMIRSMPAVLEGSPLAGYNEWYDWISEDSSMGGQPVPLRERFFALPARAWLGGVALVLTHDVHWRAG